MELITERLIIRRLKNIHECRTKCWTDLRIVVGVVVCLLMHAVSESSNCYLHRLSFEDDNNQLQYLQVGSSKLFVQGLFCKLGSEESGPFMR